MINNIVTLNAARQAQKIKALEFELQQTQQENNDLKVILLEFVAVSKNTYFGHVPTIRAIVDKLKSFDMRA